jgi:hypothetical protein
MQKFGLKFGQKLSEITFNGGHKRDHIIKYKKLLSLCPNLIAFGKRLSTHLSLFVDSNELLIPKLFETFAKNYGNSLKSISIQVRSL